MKCRKTRQTVIVKEEIITKEQNYNEFMSSLEYLLPLNNYPNFISFLGYSSKEPYKSPKK